MGQAAAEPFNDNLAFAANSLDFLSGSRDLISIRGKGNSVRPFTVVKQMEAEAEEKYKEKLTALEARINEVQAQARRAPGQEGRDGGKLLASPEATRAIEDFQKQAAAMRGERREIRLSLREGIDSLENRLLARQPPRHAAPRLRVRPLVLPAPQERLTRRLRPAMKLRTLVLCRRRPRRRSRSSPTSGTGPSRRRRRIPRVGKPLLDPDTAARAAGLVVSDQGKKVELARGRRRDVAGHELLRLAGRLREDLALRPGPERGEGRAVRHGQSGAPRAPGVQGLDGSSWRVRRERRSGA